MTAQEGIDKIKNLIFGNEPVMAPAVPVAPVALADPMTAACQACIDAGVPEPCLSTCQACITDMSPENIAACLAACQSLASDPAFGEVCSACVTALGGQAEAPAEAPADLGAAFQAEFAQFKSDFDTHKNAFTQIQSDFAAARETITKQDEAIKGLLEVVQQLSNTAVAQPAQAPASFESHNPALDEYRKAKRNH